MNTIKHFLVKNLLLLHAATAVKSAIGITWPSWMVKIWATVKIAAAASVPAWCIAQVTEWSISNSTYIAGVLTCIAIDHFVGSIYHAFKLRDFTWRRNAFGLIQKLGLCAMSAVLFEIIHAMVKEVPLVYEYLKVITRLIVIFYPAFSAFMNMSALTNGKFPPLGWINKMKNFNENLDLDKLKKQE